MRERTQPWITHKLSKMMARTITINNIHMPHWLGDEVWRSLHKLLTDGIVSWKCMNNTWPTAHLLLHTAEHAGSLGDPGMKQKLQVITTAQQCNGTLPQSLAEKRVKMHMPACSSPGVDHPLCVSRKLRALSWTDVRSGNVSIKITSGSCSFIICLQPGHQ